jgi:hypothetical protein
MDSIDRPAPESQPRNETKDKAPARKVGPVIRYLLLDPETEQARWRHSRQNYTDGTKRFWWERLRDDGNGWAMGLGGQHPSTLPLWGAHRLKYVKNVDVILVEGEKAATALSVPDAPYLVVATVCGAEVCPTREALSVLQGCRVLLWRDHDTPGAQHMRAVAHELVNGAASAVRWIDWKQAPPTGDAADFVALHGTQAVRDLISNALLEEPSFASPLPKECEPRYSRAHPPAEPAGPLVEVQLEETAWPDPPAPAAYHGPLGTIAAVGSEETEADPAAVLLSLLCGFGNLVGPSPTLMVGNTRHRMNLFVCIVGDTNIGRKGTAWDIASYVLGTLDPAWATDRVQSGIVSGEGIIEIVRDPTEEEQEEADEEQREVVRRDRRLLLLETEFARTLRVMERAGNNTEAILRLAWDGHTLQSLARSVSAKLRATDALVSLLAHITPEELRACFSDLSAANGFGNRFLWALVRRPREVPLPSPLSLDGVREDMAALQQAISAARRTVWIGGEGRHEIPHDEFDPAARALWVDRYPALSGHIPGFVGAITQRRAPLVRRLASIYALADCASCVGEAHLRAALAVWDFCARSTAALFGRRIGHTAAQNILATVRAEGKMTRTELHRALGYHVGSADIEEGLSILQQIGVIRCYEEKTPGRPRQWIEPTLSKG